MRGAVPVVRMQVGHHEQLLGNGQGPKAGHCPAGRLRKACVFQLAPTQHACACMHTQQICVSLQLTPCIVSSALLHKPSRTSQELQETASPTLRAVQLC